MTRMTCQTRRAQSGFSLIEIMIAITLSLLLIAGVLQIFLSTRATFRMQDGLSRVQESGRFAVEMMSRDIRMAGYAGCGKLENIKLNVIADDAPAFAGLQDALIGIDSATGWAAAPANWINTTDAITVQRASEGDIRLTGNLAADNANIQMNGNRYGFEADDLLFITDCQSADLFRATNVSNSGGTVTIAHAENRNSSNRLSKLYQEDATVMAFLSQTYFVGTNPAGEPALFVVINGAAPQELVDGIQDMQITYGVDTNDDRMVDAYQEAGAVADWTQVMSARVAVLAQSAENVQADTVNLTYDVAGTNVTIDDSRMRQAFSETIAVRNRVP